jgi:hypothetical protein
MLANDEQFEEGYSHFDNYINNLKPVKKDEDDMSMKEYEELKAGGMNGAEAMSALMDKQAEDSRVLLVESHLAKYRQVGHDQEFHCIDFYKNIEGKIIMHSFMGKGTHDEYKVVDSVPSTITGYTEIGLKE